MRRQPVAWISEADVKLSPIIKCISINDTAMRAVRGMNRDITFGASALTRVQEEAIATTVSAANHCRY